MKVLESFGIPLDVIPFTGSYKIKTKNHKEYLSMRVQRDDILAGRSATDAQLIDLPSRKDVLLGKGKPNQFSSGNQRLLSIMDGYLDQYHGCKSREEKTALTCRVVDMLKANGVRFLSKESGIWMEVPYDIARERVSHTFRNLRQNKANKRTSDGTAEKVQNLPGVPMKPKVATVPVDSPIDSCAAANEQSKRVRI